VFVFIDISKPLNSSTVRVTGNPDIAHISTSHGERQNLTMRMIMRRFTASYQWIQQEDREPLLCNGSLLHVLQLRQIHKTLRATPAMEAGVSDHVWSLEEIARIVI